LHIRDGIDPLVRREEKREKRISFQLPKLDSLSVSISNLNSRLKQKGVEFWEMERDSLLPLLLSSDQRIDAVSDVQLDCTFSTQPNPKNRICRPRLIDRNRTKTARKKEERREKEGVQEEDAGRYRRRKP